jgi:hypothetical protein
MAHDTNESVHPPLPGAWPVPAPSGTDSAPDIPEEILDDWRWVFQGRQEGWLEQYAGRHIAVLNQQVIASDADLRRLRCVLAETHHLDPNRVVTAYVD